MIEKSYPVPTDSIITPYKTITHDYGSYPLIIGDRFHHNGYAYLINATEPSGVRLDILTPIAAELEAVLATYSRVFFACFELRLPGGTPVEAGNEWVRQLFKKLRERLKSKYKRPDGVTSPINDLAFGWVREKERAKQDHYHCWIALPHRQVQRIGGPTYGIGSAIMDIWSQQTGGENTLVDLLGKDERYPKSYVIERGKPETLEGPIYWVSYLAKVRGKYQTGKGDRVHSTSQLRNREK